MDDLRSLATEFERFAGDVQDAGTLFSWSKALDSDNGYQFPSQQVAALNAWGMPAYYVPESVGGKLAALTELALLIRLLARRDLTAAIGHGKTFLGAVSVWVGGDIEQQQGVAADILRGDAVSLALTERQHGSDVSNSDVTATQTEAGYCLNGEKYLINNATRGQALSVFARTDHQGQSRDFSLFLVRKSEQPNEALSQVPKALTHGIRGADISGIQFHNCQIKTDALIGRKGHGLDITLKGFQLSRTLCAALSCGAADTGLRLALAFAAQRRSGQQTLVNIPNVRLALSQSAADMYACDVSTQMISRAIHCFPEQMSLLSAIVKAFVPVQCERMLESLSDVLGARSYVQVGEQTDVFGKMLRDIRLIALFDGNTAVNLQAIALQLPTLARQREKGANCSFEMLDIMFDLSAPLPAFNRDKLSLFSKRGDWLAAGLARAESLAGEFPELVEQVSRLQALLADLDNTVLSLPTEVGHPSSLRFSLAKRYCTLHVATMTVLFFLYNQPRLPSAFQRADWVEECVDQLLGEKHALDDAHCLRLTGLQVEQQELFSPIGITLNGANPSETLSRASVDDSQRHQSEADEEAEYV